MEDNIYKNFMEMTGAGEEEALMFMEMAGDTEIWGC